MFVSIAVMIIRFKRCALMLVINVLVFIYMISTFMLFKSERIPVNLLDSQADVDAIEFEQEVELPPITRKSNFSILKIYLFR